VLAEATAWRAQRFWPAEPANARGPGTNVLAMLPKRTCGGGRVFERVRDLPQEARR